MNITNQVISGILLRNYRVYDKRVFFISPLKWSKVYFGCIDMDQFDVGLNGLIRDIKDSFG